MIGKRTRRAVSISLSLLVGVQVIPQHSLAESDIPTRLLVRNGNNDAVDASPEDLALAKTYHVFADKGHLVNGQRITILTRKNRYKVGEVVTVLHILESVQPGIRVFVAGPKPITGEYLDGKLVKAAPDPSVRYIGPAPDRPIADFNYDITRYTFKEPGRHSIQWKGGGYFPMQGSLGLTSNTIKLDIAKE